MACTTILVGKKASYDGSTLVARNEDCGSDGFTAKRFEVVLPENQPKVYRSVLSHVEIPLPENPMRYTAMPDADLKIGQWAAVGVNTCNVSMSATETLTTNVRVQGADPMVEYIPAQGKEGEEGYVPEVAGGIGEEDMVTIVLPYIKSAREGVLRLGSLLEKYGTYENNGIAFQDVNEIWWLESIGGHHWMARRVLDDCYVIMPNQLGLDHFDFEDAYGAQKDYLCSEDLKEFMEKHHLNLSFDQDFNPRDAFGSHSDADHVYNTPRAWVAQRFLNPTENRWDGLDADYRPTADDIPWCRVAERKITVEDVKEILSNHYQGTPYDPYGSKGDTSLHGLFRPIGINRNSQLACVQIRPYMPESCRTIEWVTFASNVFNAFCPLYVNVNRAPHYFTYTPAHVSTDSFYWASRLMAALSDPHFSQNIAHVEHYQENVGWRSYKLLEEWDKLVLEKDMSYEDSASLLEEANEAIAKMLREETDTALDNVLEVTSRLMKNAFARADR